MVTSSGRNEAEGLSALATWSAARTDRCTNEFEADLQGSGEPGQLARAGGHDERVRALESGSWQRTSAWERAADAPLALVLVDSPLAVLAARLVPPPPVVKLRAHDLDREPVPSRRCALLALLRLSLADDGEEARGRRDDVALVGAVEDEVAAGEEHLARARHDGRGARGGGRGAGHAG